MNPFFEFFKKLSQGFFFLIQRMIGEQHAARYLRENLEVMQEVGKTAAETIDLADQLAVGNNPDKQRLAALIKDYANEGMKQVLTGQLPAEEVRAIESDHPFSENSEPSRASLPGTPRPLPTPEPSRSTPPPQPPPTAKRGRGRPRKSPPQ
jgi:hypothetical protein